MRFIRREKGFTLIELLIVVAILAVLAVVIIPNISRFIGAGDLAAANTEADTLRVAALAYEASNNGTVPSGNYGADNQGVLDEFIRKTLVGSYTISDTGELTGTGGWDRLDWSPDGMWIEGGD